VKKIIKTGRNVGKVREKQDRRKGEEVENKAGC
jgi:hypothetical protein